MKTSKSLSVFAMLAFVFSTSFTFSSCSKDEGDEGSDNVVNVVVKEDGTISGNNTFSVIDEKNFYINDIKYSVVEGHLEVTGYDQVAFSGEAKIVESLNYKGNVYKVLVINRNAFHYCKKLTSVFIPNSIITINFDTFSSCM